MDRGFLRLVFLLLAAATLLPAQQSSGLVGTWVGKVQGFEVEMRLVLNADGSGDFEGVQGSWRVQGNRLLLTEESETVAYDFRLQGSQLVLSGGDLMAPLAGDRRFQRNLLRKQRRVSRRLRLMSGQRKKRQNRCQPRASRRRVNAV